MPVRPFVSVAQVEREDPTILDVHRFEDVRLEPQSGGVADQARITVNHHHTGVFRPAHQHPYLAAGTTDGFELCQVRFAWQPFVGFRQLSARHFLLEERCLLSLGPRRPGHSQRESYDKADPFHITPPYPLISSTLPSASL
jgi:hypothetical protein